MTAGTSHAPTHHHLHVPGDTPVHRLAPEAKLAGLIAFVVAVALTPRQAVPVFAVDALVLVVVVVLARLRARMVLGRLLVVAPFVAFAVLVPFVAGGDEVEVWGVALSEDGLWSTFNILAKASLGAGASIVVSATTSVPEVLRGLSRLRLPAPLVAIIAFMFRYLDLVVDQVRRMRAAMVARCHDPRWLWQARPVAASAGTLFVRSYERGERIHHAMVARGYAGTMPDLHGSIVATPAHWGVAAAPAAIALVGLVIATAIT